MRAAIAALVLSSVGVGGLVGRAVAAPPRLAIYQDVVGTETTHVVVAGETLGAIAHRFGIKTHLAATINQLSDPNRLRIGQRLLLSNRHIVPTTLANGLIINVGDLMLYWMISGAPAAVFPVGVGRAAWATPRGHYRIVSRRHDPTWYVPRSIQAEMRAQGEPIKKKVPPGPDNPLGKYWLQLSAPGYGIHGTNAPWTIGKYTTHGCIRLYPDDIERLYKEVPNGTAVDVIDEPIKLARLSDGTVLLEAHPGISRPPSESATVVLEQVEHSDVAALVDPAAARRVLQQAWGIAIDVSKRAVPGQSAAGSVLPTRRSTRR